ncbi:amidohydrolase family protein [Saccharococcus sp. Marseille-Q5394]|uniref:amidohydrolase family protein n=1 Tax=Saccharococcus sp. Marseille-Q5394 TaxID=2972778 RepID=UPI0021C60628|nr:amidohydrolase family protein [Saccharococcus sp. Marseille-Q5394]
MVEYMNYVVKNGMIIDVENGRSFLGSIEIKETKIRKVYQSNDPLPEGVSVIDAQGKYIIPGLLDMHCHIQERFAPHFLASGVTTVRNTAGNVYMLENLIHAPIDAPSPTVYAADRMIDGTPGLWGPTSFGNFVTDDPVEARKEVRRQVGAGAKFIKVYGWANREVMHAAVDEAKKFEVEVSCDLIHSKDLNALDAAQIGVTWFEHASGFAQAIYPGWYPSADQTEWSHINWDTPDENKIQELCQQMIHYNVKLCPTLVVTDQVEQSPDYWYPKNNITKSLEKNNILIEHWRNMSEQIDLLNEQVGKLNKFTKKIAKTYFDLGGTVVTGTDTPALIWTIPGMALHRELELFVEIGLTEMEALQAATIKAARSINLGAVGAIKEGNIADIIILNNNPLEDIKHTKDIHRVIKGGKVFSLEEILTHVPSEDYMEQQFSEFQRKWETDEYL